MVTLATLGSAIRHATRVPSGETATSVPSICRSMLEPLVLSRRTPLSPAYSQPADTRWIHVTVPTSERAICRPSAVHSSCPTRTSMVLTVWSCSPPSAGMAFGAGWPASRTYRRTPPDAVNTRSIATAVAAMPRRRRMALARRIAASAGSAMADPADEAIRRAKAIRRRRGMAATAVAMLLVFTASGGVLRYVLDAGQPAPNAIPAEGGLQDQTVNTMDVRVGQELWTADGRHIAL